ncbi:glycosyltransferase family 4 protein [Ideonella livida]|uniref:Glycosyltransferase family 4 protein n=1 Tax=Ideonella livida TaxID=2707176 RepID=A0A7C9PGN3_9BURK|nr:glycosyltransferase family 4 protein [Ideonella livida]NDY90910.1 glycosyltransferase family 4 protein [Ideonella livida]
MSRARRVLVVAHGHPELSRGGAEQAAYDEYRALGAMPGHESFLLARAPLSGSHGGTPFSVYRAPSEFLFHSDMPDLFKLSQPIKHMVWSGFREFLLKLRPDVVHFHHYVFLGVELISEVRRTLPEAKIILTLHEFWALCHREGLMVRAQDDRLCSEATPRACHACFPAYTPEDFLLRNSFIKSHLAGVDAFVTPSEFLRQRYVDWGLPAHRVHTLENGQAQALTRVVDRPGTHPNRQFAFFGQINKWKGLDLLLDALAIVLDRRKEGDPLPTLNVHGANLENQEAAVRERISTKLEKLRPHVQFHGAYRKEDLPELMAEAGWVVVPSIWWENSPLVIQEAFSLGRPVIAANIGGMAEKVRHDVDGLHFRARDAGSLAATLEMALDDPTLWPRLRAGIANTPGIAEQVQKIMALVA